MYLDKIAFRYRSEGETWRFIVSHEDLSTVPAWGLRFCYEGSNRSLKRFTYGIQCIERFTGPSGSPSGERATMKAAPTGISGWRRCGRHRPRAWPPVNSTWSM